MTRKATIRAKIMAIMPCTVLLMYSDSTRSGRIIKVEGSVPMVLNLVLLPDDVQEINWKRVLRALRTVPTIGIGWPQFLHLFCASKFHDVIEKP
jgi:hypothetical protein